KALLGSPPLAVLVEELRPDRVRFGKPEGRHQADDRHDDAPDRHPELLLRRVEEGEDDAHHPEGTDDGLDLVGDLGGHVDPAAKADQQHPRDGRRDDHGVDRPPALLLPIDVLQVEPEREFVERQPRPDAEEHSDDLPPWTVRRDRNGDVAEDQEQQDAPDQVVNVRPADREVARPPLHLGLDHVRARPDEAEGDEKGDEEEEMRLAAGVDDPVLVGAAYARRGQHGRKASGACYGIPRVISQLLAMSTPPEPRQVSLADPPISLSGPGPPTRRSPRPPPTSVSEPPPPISRSLRAPPTRRSRP